jgi:putative aldouronate transport system permease protein
MRKRKIGLFGVLNLAFLIALSIVIIYPAWYTFLISISRYEDAPNVILWTPHIDFSAYKSAFEGRGFLRAFFNSAFITVVGVTLNLLVSAMTAYALSLRKWEGKGLFLAFVLIPMFFSGGLIPYYLTIKSLGLVNTIWVMIAPVAVNMFYVLILMNNFRAIPASLAESARLDGGSDLLILFRIILPVSKPTLSAIGLFYAVERWNEWWHGLLFVNDLSAYPLQLILREMIVNIEGYVNNSMASSLMDSMRNVYAPSLRMATVMIAAVPVMIVYPFLQKNFTKGIMIGAIKG